MGDYLSNVRRAMLAQDRYYGGGPPPQLIDFSVLEARKRQKKGKAIGMMSKAFTSMAGDVSQVKLAKPSMLGVALGGSTNPAR